MSNDKLINFCFGKFAIYDHVYVCYGLNIKVYFNFFEIYLERWLKRLHDIYKHSASRPKCFYSFLFNFTSGWTYVA